VKSMRTGRWAQRRLERRLIRVHAELDEARSEVTVAEEQLVAFTDDADEAKVRSLVSENRFDAQTADHATRHREVMQRALDHARQRVEELAATELELLSKLEP